jgi:hypothetical protein
MKSFSWKNRRKGATILSHIQHHPISHIDGRIYGVAAYYSENDATQHVVVATHDGTLYEVHWNRNTSFTPPQQFTAQFPGIASLCGFFTPDDNRQHVVVATENGQLYELYSPNLQNAQPRPLVPTGSSAGLHIGMAGYYSPDDGLRHVVVGNNDSILYDVAWSSQVVPEAQILTTQFILPDVAAIAGFFDPSVYTHDTIVAMKGGDVYDVYYSGGLAGAQPTTARATGFSASLVNVAAFVSPNTHVRHIILLDASGQVHDYSYTQNPLQLFGATLLVTLSNVVDMAAYYSDYDRTNHVILVTFDGTVHEVYYT